MQNNDMITGGHHMYENARRKHTEQRPKVFQIVLRAGRKRSWKFWKASRRERSIC